MLQPDAVAQRPLLDIAIVNWNAGLQLQRCLESIAASAAAVRLGRVVVVDNGSTDGSAECLEMPGLPLVVLRNAANRGFAAACNQAARECAAEFLLFLNPDTLLNTESLSRPLEYMLRPENRDAGVCGIRLVDDNGHVSRNCTRIPAPRHFAAKMLGLDRVMPRRFPSHFMEEWDHAESRDVDHVMGAFYLIRADLFHRLGGFDERFFVYLEDLDLSLRVHGAGFRIHFLAEATAYHKGGGTSEQVKARRLFYSLRSRILYGFKHFRSGTAILLMAGTLLLEPWPRLALAVAKRSPGAVKETLGGYAALWRAWPPWRAMPQ